MIDQSDVLSKTSQCVKCGLCSNVCPTYQEFQEEGESPRGRISLIESLYKGDLTLTDRMQKHLDNCLQCRSCETKCPSNVEYGAIIDGYKAYQFRQNKKSLPWWLKLLLNKRSQTLVHVTEVISRHLKLSRLKSHLSKAITGPIHLEKSIKTDARFVRLKQYYPAQTEKKRVLLFAGCIHQAVARYVLIESITLLNALGYSVHLANEQTCCGGLDLHHGDTKTYQHTKVHNESLFSRYHDVSAIVSLATGCQSVLTEYSDETKKKLIDVNTLLYQELSQLKASITPTDERIGVYLPCSFHQLGLSQQTFIELISLCSTQEIEILTTKNSCCGAAGQYMLSHPTIAASIREPLIEQIKQLNLNYLVTPNIGCQMHLNQGLTQQKISTEVLHPVSLVQKLHGS